MNYNLRKSAAGGCDLLLRTPPSKIAMTLTWVEEMHGTFASG